MEPSCEIRVIPVPFAGEILPGDDLAEKLAAALRHQKLKLQTGDVLVVKHKIVSKAEGQVVSLNSVKTSSAAKSWARRSGSDARVIELVLSESRRIVRKKKGVLITETRHGLVCANSGVDVSNVDGGTSAVLLPKNPDGAAANANMHLGSRLNGFDYDALGAHFGLHGERVDAPDKLKGALQTGLKKVQDGTTAILNVMLSK